MIDLTAHPDGAVPPPPVRSRRARLARWLAIGTTIGVVAVTVVLSRPASVGLGRSIPGLALSPNAPHETVDTIFLNNQTGYRIQAYCTATCVGRFVVTSDGGRTWSARRLPADLFGLGEARDWRLTPLGAGVAIDALATGAGRIGTERRWSTSDGVHEWVELTAAPGDTVAEIPAGATLVFPRTDVALDNRLQALGTNGMVVWLKAGPHGRPGANARPVRATDGSWWATDSEAGAIVVSRDQGRTWVPVRALDPQATPEILTVDGQTVYLAVSALRLIRSRDGGATWAELALPTGDPASYALTGAGDLLVCQGGRLYRSAADGFVPTGTQFVDVASAGGLVLAQGGTYASADGESWWPVGG